MTEFDIRQKDYYVAKYLGFTFEKKIQHLTSFTDEQLPEINPI